MYLFEEKTASLMQYSAGNLVLKTFKVTVSFLLVTDFKESKDTL